MSTGKLKKNFPSLTNHLAKINKTLERMEPQLEISKTINNTLEKGIRFSVWRGISDSTDETKVCELIEKVTSINVNQNCIDSCHLLPSDEKKTKTKS